MPNTTIYLDYAATTPLDPRVLAAMQPYLTDATGNPSSLHGKGRRARTALEEARHRIAEALGAQPTDIIFTSGGTEADNLAVLGVARAQRAQGRGSHVITSAIEHPAVLNACQQLEREGFSVTYLPVDEAGRVSVEAVEAALRAGTLLVSLMHANNEVGTLQPLEAVGAFLRDRGIPFHTDAVQTVGKLHIDLRQLPVDFLSLSAHKLYGPKGVGALYLRDGAPRPQPLQFGGTQEFGLRAGTENVAGIVGLAEALTLALADRETEATRLRTLQTFFVQGLQATVGECYVLNSPTDPALGVPGIINVSFPPTEGEALVLRLDLKGIAVSSGSACHSQKIDPSHVLLAIGKQVEVAKSTVRFSLGRHTTQAELEQVLAILPGVLGKGAPVPKLVRTNI